MRSFPKILLASLNEASRSPQLWRKFLSESEQTHSSDRSSPLSSNPRHRHLVHHLTWTTPPPQSPLRSPPSTSIRQTWHAIYQTSSMLWTSTKRRKVTSLTIFAKSPVRSPAPSSIWRSEKRRTLFVLAKDWRLYQRRTSLDSSRSPLSQADWRACYC